MDEQKLVSRKDKNCATEHIMDTNELKNSFTLIEQYTVKIRTLDQYILLREGQFHRIKNIN